MMACHRPIHRVLAVAASLLALAGCASTAAAPISTPDPPGAPPAGVSPAAASATATPETPATIALSVAGVGGVTWDQPGAADALEVELGRADEVADLPQVCDVGADQTMRWGALTVGLQGGSLVSWAVDGEHGDLPAGVTLPYDLGVGSPLAEVAALDGAQAPVLLPDLGSGVHQQVQVSPPGSSEPLLYWLTPDEPVVVTHVYGRTWLGCD